MGTKKKTISKLNDILRHEWTGVAQYAQASFVVSGLWREVYSSMFMTSADESLAHAKLIGAKISALGGVPTIERNKVQQSDDVMEMLEHAIAFEQKAVEYYTEALAISDESDRALTVLLEDVLLQEQEGVDHLQMILRQHRGAADESGAQSKAS